MFQTLREAQRDYDLYSDVLTYRLARDDQHCTTRPCERGGSEESLDGSCKRDSPFDYHLQFTYPFLSIIA